MGKDYLYTKDGLVYINEDFILQEFTDTKWHGSNKQAFLDAGYIYTKYGDPLQVKTTDLMSNSTVRIMGLCSDCGKYRKVRFSNVYKNNHSLCRNCVSARYFDPFSDGKLNHEAIIGKKFDKFKVVGYVGKTEKGSELFICDYSNGYNDVRNTSWIDKVKTRDVICQVCGCNDDLVAHHLNSFSDFNNERDELSNGITVCKTCHSEFHTYMGGTINKCTTKDFYKWYFVVKNADVVKDVKPLLSMIDIPADIISKEVVKIERSLNGLLNMKSLMDEISVFGFDIYLAVEGGADTIRKISDVIGENVNITRRNAHRLRKHGFLYNGSRTVDGWLWFVNTDINWEEMYKNFDVIVSSHISNEKLLKYLIYDVPRRLRSTIQSLDKPMTIVDLSEKLGLHKQTIRTNLNKLRNLGIVEKESYYLWKIASKYGNGTKESL